MIRAYVGLGANLGDPIQQILDARRMLSADTAILNFDCSALYLTSPVGYGSQSDFVNCVCKLETDLSAQDLLFRMQSIENACGRKRDSSNQNAPRSIDLDLLLYGDEAIQSEDLTVPHPRLEQRLFTLIPLLELASRFKFKELEFVKSAIEEGQAEGLFFDQSIYRLT